MNKAPKQTKSIKPTTEDSKKLAVKTNTPVKGSQPKKSTPTLISEPVKKETVKKEPVVKKEKEVVVKADDDVDAEEKEKFYPNKETFDAGLTLNVKKFKLWITEQFDVMGEKKPTYKGGHIALTACVEELIVIILKTASPHLQKEGGIYSFSSGSIVYATQINPDLSKLFEKDINVYSENTVYGKIFPEERKKITDIIEKYNNNYKFDNLAYNILTYLLTKFSEKIIKYSSILLDYSGIKSLNSSNIKACVKILCSDTLAKQLSMKIEGSCGSEKEEKEEVVDSVVPESIGHAQVDEEIEIIEEIVEEEVEDEPVVDEPVETEPDPVPSPAPVKAVKNNKKK